MKLLGWLIIFLCVIVVFFAVCKILDPTITVQDILESLAKLRHQQVQPVQPMYLGDNPLYRKYQMDYENFASLLWSCLDQIGTKCELTVPSSPVHIFCPEVGNRVKNNNNLCIFSFEVRRQEPRFEGGMRQIPMTSTKEIADILTENLPSYMSGGYYYIGQVFVWDTEKNRVRIEVQGVARQYFVPEVQI